jgi:hypothetical protein
VGHEKEQHTTKVQLAMQLAGTKQVGHGMTMITSLAICRVDMPAQCQR